MNFAELEREVARDVEKLRTTTEPRLVAQYDKERRKYKIDKTREYPKMYSVKTASKNNWLIFIRKLPADAVYKGSVIVCYVVYYYNSKGLSVICYSTRGIDLYYGHFFKRYNERMNLGLSDTLDAVKKYFMQCGGNAIFNTMEKKGKTILIGFSGEGILLGEVQQNGRLYVNKTFVSRDLAYDSQDAMEQELVVSLMNELVSAEVKKIQDAYLQSVLYKIAFSKNEEPEPAKKIALPNIPNMPNLPNKPDHISIFQPSFRR